MWKLTKKSQNRMIKTEQEMCEKNMVPGITAIIPTYNCNPRLFSLSLLSLLNSTNKEYLKHIIVVINGPDRRTDYPEIQDRKQEFLEALREKRWHDDFVPITVMRVWSRLGHSQSIDAAVPWVHTKDYMILHDDVIFTGESWAEKTRKLLEDPSTGLVYSKLLCALPELAVHDKGLTFPHLCTEFAAVRKSRLLNMRWTGYTVKFPEEKVDISEISKDYTIVDSRENGRGNSTASAESISHDVGAYIFNSLKDSELEFQKLDPSPIQHLCRFSWCSIEEKKKKIEDNYELINGMEIQLRNNIVTQNIFQLYFDFFGDYRFYL